MTNDAHRDGRHSTGGFAERRALAALCLCMLLSSLGTSIANVALPTLAQAFDASFRQAQWVVLAYLVAITSLVVGVGRLADLAGRRRLLLGGLVVFTTASAACSAAPTLVLLVAARAVQGVGAAVLLALPLAFVGELVPRERIGRAMGLLGTMSAVGTALGPSLGGLLIAGPGWRAIFLVNLPLGALAVWLVRRHLPVDRRTPRADMRDEARFDAPGTAWLALALGAYALAMTSGAATGARGLALLAAAACAAALFVRTERRAPSPLVPMARLRDAGTGTGLALSALVSTVMMATLVVGPFHLAQALGLPAALVGLAMSVGPVVSAASGAPAGRLVDRFGAWPVLRAGLVAMAVGAGLLAVLPAALGVAGYVAPLGVLTAGYAAFQAANNTAVLSGVAPGQRGVVSGLLNLARYLGLVTGAAVLGAVFASASKAVDVAMAPRAGVAAGTQATFALSTVLIGVALVLALRGRAAAHADGVRGADEARKAETSASTT